MPSLRLTRCLHGGQVHSPAPCELPTIGGLLRSPEAHEEIARRQVWCMPRDKLSRPVAANPCRPCGSRSLPHCGVRFAHHNTHPTLACLFVVRALLISFDNTSSRSQPMPCKSCTASYHNTSQHIPHYSHSQVLFQCLFPFASPSPHSSSPNHTPLFANVLLGVCSGFLFVCAVLFSFFVFLTFFSFGGVCLLGSLGNSGFGLLFLILRISGFSAFWRISRYGWFFGFSPFFEKFSFCLLFVLSCQQVWQGLNLRPKLTAPRLLSSPTHKPATTHSSPQNTTLPNPTQPQPTNSAPHPPLEPSTSQTHPQ